MGSFLSRLFTWLSRRGDDERLEAEVDEHLALQTADNIHAGMTPAEARRQALLKFGGPEKIKEEYRDQRSAPFLENLRQDTRFAIRQLRKRPGFTLTAMLMLGPGICASVAIFAFVDAALVKPLPYRNPERLVGVYESVPQCPQCNQSYLDYLDWKKFNTVLSSLDAYQNSGFSLSKPEGAEQVGGARVSAGFFRTLGISPVLGRDFHSGEDLPEAPRTVMLSYSAWQKRYGGRKDVLGQSVTLNGDPNIIIGVLPHDFHFAPAEPAEFWSAIHATSGCYLRRSCHNLYGVGRLKDGVPLESALANFKGIAQQLERQYPDSNRDQGARIVSLTAVIVGDIRPMLLVLLSGAGLLLLIASMNVASLLLVRSECRQREMSVRSALGGSTLRLTSQFVAEASSWWQAVIGLLLAGWPCGYHPAHPGRPARPDVSVWSRLNTQCCSSRALYRCWLWCCLLSLPLPVSADTRAGLAEAAAVRRGPGGASDRS
jgi:predicted permease